MFGFPFLWLELPNAIDLPSNKSLIWIHQSNQIAHQQQNQYNLIQWSNVVMKILRNSIFEIEFFVRYWNEASAFDWQTLERAPIWSGYRVNSTIAFWIRCHCVLILPSILRNDMRQLSSKIVMSERACNIVVCLPSNNVVAWFPMLVQFACFISCASAWTRWLTREFASPHQVSLRWAPSPLFW